MNYSQIISILKQKVGSMVLFGLFLGAVAFWGTMLFSPKYQSNLDVLVIQNQEGFIDSYTLAKSTEHFSKLLSESIYTETFLMKTAEHYPEISKILPISREEKMEAWSKMVKTSLNMELGIIHLKILANDRTQAESISKTVAGVLASDNQLFISENQKIDVRMINAPVVKNNPGFSALALLVAVSFLIGIFSVSAVVFYKVVSKMDSLKSANSEIFRERIWQENISDTEKDLAGALANSQK